MESWLVKIEQIATDVAKQNGCELYDVELVGTGQGRVLRVFIDKDETGIGIEDCSNVSKGMTAILDENEDLVPGGMYNLEVSSPGLDRHLKKSAHFDKVVGKKIYVQLSQNLGSIGATDKTILNMKKFEEVLAGFEDEHLIFNFKNETVKVPLNIVDKAKLTFEMQQNTKGPKKK
ncbi:MAG: ribosome maturation factor RimP [Pseudobdellovibrio sp.]